MEIHGCSPRLWDAFKQYHYLSHSIPPNCDCYAAVINGQPVGFLAVTHGIGKTIYYRVSRVVVLPDYQGIGIGTRLSDWLGSILSGAGYRYYSRTSHPAMIAHRRRSLLWQTIAEMGFTSTPTSASSKVRRTWRGQMGRLAASFRYVGPTMDPQKAVQLLTDARRVAV